MWPRDATIPTAASDDATLSLLQELGLVIKRTEQQMLPTCHEQHRRRPEPAFPAQLPEAQIVTVPCDGLCLCHVCIASYDAQEWCDQHGEKGYRVGHNRSQEQAEEHQARGLLAQVLQLMHDYAEYDSSHHHYAERASRIAAGALPEDYGLQFYAACLNGCIECVPLGFADSQEPSLFGAGPLRVSIGHVLEKGDDDAFAGHFVLLQSWLPVEKDLRKRGAFPFGAQACSTMDTARAVGCAD